MWKEFLKKDGHLIKPFLMESKKTYDVLCSIFYDSWITRKYDAKDYSFD